jgi:hypothetical protein
MEEDADEEWEPVEGADVEDDWDMCEDAERYRVTKDKQTWNKKMRGFFESERKKRKEK